MQWNRTNLIGLAKASCTYCQGHGLRLIHKDKEVPCNCVFRAMFRSCYNRFRECAIMGAQPGKVSLESGKGPTGHAIYSRKREEYAADFVIVSRRVLTEEELRIFRFHFLLGADWRLCCDQLRMDRGDFFHMVYRIEQVLGKTFATLEPYGLYPLAEYFGTVVDRALPCELPPPLRKRQAPVRLPMRPMKLPAGV